jgi:hypothetical protein
MRLPRMATRRSVIVAATLSVLLVGLTVELPRRFAARCQSWFFVLS